MKTISLFAQRLRALRNHTGMSQEQVANALNIHRTAYTKYETDKAYPDRDRLLLMANLFHVSVDYLLGREEEVTATLEMRDGEAEITLTLQELQLLLHFRGLTEGQRQEILAITKDIAKPKD